MTKWQEVKLGDEIITTLIGDGLHGTPVYSEKGKYAFINGNNLVGGHVIIKSDTKMVEEAEYIKYKKDLTNRTLLVSINGTLGNVAEYNNERIILGKSACYLNISLEVDKLFIKYILLSSTFQNYLQNNATGTTIKNVSLKQIREYPFYLPPLATQKKIAGVLSALDDKIELNNKINQNLEQQAQALFKSWFIDFEPFGGTMPTDWKEKDIYNIANIIYGAPFASKLFNTEKKGKPIIRIRDLKNQHSETYTEEVHPKAYLIKAGDIVVGMDGEFRPYIWGNDEGLLNQRVCVFDNKRSKGKMFLYLTIKPLLNKVEQTEVATTVIHIGKQDFDAFKFYMPDEKILDEFDEITSSIYNQIVTNSIENTRLAQLRDTLLPKLMSGEIDVDKIKLDELNYFL